MMNISVSIDYQKVMNLVEGLSATVGQHVQGENIDFEQMWASNGDVPKLDIYFGGAISSLKAALKKKVAESVENETSSDGKTDGEASRTVTLTLEVHDRWRSGLKGLLTEMCEEYVAYAVFAGWLSTFPGIDQAKLYTDMAENDLTEILAILEQREFADTSGERGTDVEAGDVEAVSAGERGTDVEAGDVEVMSAGARKYNDVEIISHYPDAEERRGEVEKMYDDGGGVPLERHEDDSDDKAPHTGEGERHSGRDVARVRHHRDRFDLSGEGVQELLERRKKIFR